MTVLNELFFALLGFTGDVMIEDGEVLRVCDGCDMFSEAEKLQLNRILPLGWFYTKFNDIVSRYDISWKNSKSPSGCQIFKAALSLSVSDMLTEYVDNVTYLEQLVLTDGPVPLSHVTQHLQKFLMVFPQLFAMITEIEEKPDIHGCQLIDYFSNLQSGVPVVATVISRILLRLRLVLVKQIFAWMVYGELEDAAAEFFVSAQVHTADSLDMLGRVKARFAPSETGDATAGSFDWVNSYNLRQSTVPSSHITPRMASKVLFAGKAVKLLQSSAVHSAGPSDDAQRSDVFGYLRAGQLSSRDVGTIFGSGDENASVADSLRLAPSGTGGAPVEVESATPPLHGTQPLEGLINSCGYSAADVQRFTRKFEAVLDQPENAVELLEAAVDDVNETISNQLWQLLRDRLGFTSHLQAIRNTYLLGKGELFQSVLDEVLLLTESSGTDDAVSGLAAATPQTPQQMDATLNWTVLRNSAKLLGLDEDDMLRTVQLRVRGAASSFSDLPSHVQAGDISLTGSARVGSDPDATRTLCLCRSRPSGNATAAALSDADQDDAWLLPLLSPLTSNVCRPVPSTSVASHSDLEADFGGAWFSDARPVAKGFSLSVDVCVRRGDGKDSHSSGSRTARAAVAIAVCGSRKALSSATCISLLAPDWPTTATASPVILVGVCFQEGNDKAKISILLGSATSVPVTEAVVDLRKRGAADGGDVIRIEVRYVREAGSDSSGASGISYRLKARAVAADSDSAGVLDLDAAPWALVVPMDVGQHIRLDGGTAFLGVLAAATAPDALTARDGADSVHLRRVSFEGKSALSTYPSASPFTTARFPDTSARIGREIASIRDWMGIKLRLSLPALFQTVFDAEAVAVYDRLFAATIKVRMLSLALEKLWMARSRRANERVFCHLSHSMHFFISNLLYYQQVDVVDSEFCALQRAVREASDFQTVLRAHRAFLATVVRLSMVDNAALQEALDRIMHVCLRFVAVCRLQHQAEEQATAGRPVSAVEDVIFVPPEELEAIREDFFTQVQLLFQILRNVESRGFMFRLDFNGFLSGSMNNAENNS